MDGQSDLNQYNLMEIECRSRWVTLSPLQKYYTWSTAFVAGLVCIFLIDAYNPAVAAKYGPIGFLASFGSFLYSTFCIGCPKCGKSLGLMINGFRHGLPGRYCTRCHADLTQRRV